VGVRYVIIDPTCTSVSGETKSPPLLGRPVYAGDRIAVFQIAPTRGRRGS